MNDVDFKVVRNRRLHGIRSAALVSLMGRRAGINVDQVSWETLSTVPSWCLASVADRQLLQSVCGVLYLRPLIQSSIDGEFLREVRSLVGQSLFSRILGDTSIEGCEVSNAACDLADYSVMECGGSVLLSSLSDSRLRSLFEVSLGECSVEIQPETADAILAIASTLIGEEPAGKAVAARK